jgi:hypothetical protein
MILYDYDTIIEDKNQVFEEKETCSKCARVYCMTTGHSTTVGASRRHVLRRSLSLSLTLLPRGSWVRVRVRVLVRLRLRARVRVRVRVRVMG